MPQEEVVRNAAVVVIILAIVGLIISEVRANWRRDTLESDDLAASEPEPQPEDFEPETIPELIADIRAWLTGLLRRRK